MGVSSLLFDCDHNAGGGVYMAHGMGATLSDVFFYGFTSVGIQLDGGHEVMVQDAWLAEYYWNEKSPANSSSIGVQINGNDHYLDNVIVFDYTNVGVEINGAANVLTTVHTWNGGGVGIRINSWQTRLSDCYLDYNYLEITDPSETVVEDTFFLVTHAVLKANKGTMTDLIMKHNTFYGAGGKTVRLEGSFARENVTRVSLEDDVNGNVATRLTTTTRKASLDLGDALLFPWIDYVQMTAVGDASAFVESINGTTVNLAGSLLQNGEAEVHLDVRQGQ